MPSASSRIGIFGGAFDPIHFGHLILAEEACARLALDCVYFVPTGDPPHKQDRRLTPVAHRLQMTELATALAANFFVSRIDAERPGPHYSVDMVQLLQAQLGAQAQLYFLMGMDSLRDLLTWHNPQWLVDYCTLVVLNRPEITPDWAALEAALPDLRARLILLEMPALAISSTLLRARIAAGEPIRYQTPAAVEAYIRKYGLYR